MICLRQSLSPVNMRQLRSAVASSGCSSGRLLYQGHVDASEGMHPFELEGSKRKSTLAYIRHIVKYQVDSLPSCSSPCCHPLHYIHTPSPPVLPRRLRTPPLRRPSLAPLPPIITATSTPLLLTVPILECLYPSEKQFFFALAQGACCVPFAFASVSA